MVTDNGRMCSGAGRTGCGLDQVVGLRAVAVAPSSPAEPGRRDTLPGSHNDMRDDRHAAGVPDAKRYRAWSLDRNDVVTAGCDQIATGVDHELPPL